MVGRVATPTKRAALIDRIDRDPVHGYIEPFGYQLFGHVGLLLMHPHFQPVVQPARQDAGHFCTCPEVRPPPGCEFKDLVGLLKTFFHVAQLIMLARVMNLIARGTRA